MLKPRAPGDEAILAALREIAPDAPEHDRLRFAHSLAISVSLWRAEPKFRGTRRGLAQLAILKSRTVKMMDALEGMGADELVATTGAFKSLGAARPLDEFLDRLFKTLAEFQIVVEDAEALLQASQRPSRNAERPANETAFKIAEQLWRYAEALGHDPRAGPAFEKALGAIYRAIGLEASAKHFTDKVRERARARQKTRKNS